MLSAYYVFCPQQQDNPVVPDDKNSSGPDHGSGDQSDHGGTAVQQQTSLPTVSVEVYFISTCFLIVNIYAIC